MPFSCASPPFNSDAITQTVFVGCSGTRFVHQNREISVREPSQLATGAWNRAASNHLRAHRDKTGLGHCNFQFYGNAAWHYFSLAALLFEASDVGGTGRNSLG
jgi:hypothetical protein